MKYITFNRYINTKLWILFIINIAIYIISLTLELKFIYLDSFYYQELGHKLGSEEAILKEMSVQRGMDIYNYLWIPVHILISCSLIALCLFIGFNIANIRLNIKNCIRFSLAGIIVFSINYLISVILKIFGIVQYNYNTVDDIYSYQSVNVLFIGKKLPAWAFKLLGQINITEVVFVLFLSLLISRYFKFKYPAILLKTSLIYGGGLIIYGILSAFADIIL